jgi:DNA-binding TFAR19-related protein (PDSD5 family)
MGGEDGGEGIEGVRKKKLAAAYREAQKRQMAEEQIRSAMAALLEPEAYSRLMNVRMSNPEVYAQAVQSVAYLRQAGQLKARLNEAQLLSLLHRLAARNSRETSITFKRKGSDSEG